MSPRTSALACKYTRAREMCMCTVCISGFKQVKQTLNGSQFKLWSDSSQVLLQCIHIVILCLLYLCPSRAFSVCVWAGIGGSSKRWKQTSKQNLHGCENNFFFWHFRCWKHVCASCFSKQLVCQRAGRRSYPTTRPEQEQAQVLNPRADLPLLFIKACTGEGSEAVYLPILRLNGSHR